MLVPAGRLLFLSGHSVYKFLSFIQAFEELEALLARSDVCIAVKEKLVKDSGVADERAYDEIVQKLLTKPRARGLCHYYTLSHGSFYFSTYILATNIN